MMGKGKTAVEERREVGFAPALFVFVFLFVAILCGTRLFGTTAHIPLVLASVVAAIVAICNGYRWSELQDGMGETIKATCIGILIMPIIGMVVGTWMLGGIVPTMIYYGLTWLSPKIFLVATCLICTMVSLAVGSSWTTMGTVGVALMGVGAGLNVPMGMTAGAIISGAYFGDKMSPLSDCTNLTSAVVGTDLFGHIKNMLRTTTPAYCTALILYAILGFKVVGNSANTDTITLYLNTLADSFHIGPVMMIPPLCVLVMVVFKVSAIPGLLGVTFLGGIFAVAFQGRSLAEVFAAAYTGVSMDTGVEAINKLVNRGGLSSMMDTVALILIALCFAGIVEKSGMIRTVVNKILSRAKGEKAIMTTAFFATLFTNFATGVVYVAFVLPGRMFRQTFLDHDLHPKNLSLILEDVGSLVAPFCPWSTDCAFIMGALGVSLTQYAPFMFLAILNPLVCMFFIWSGIGIVHIDPSQRDMEIIP